METEHTFIRDEVYPSYFVNALTKFLSLGVWGFVLAKADDTHVHVVAGDDANAAIIAVQGRWRWTEATVSRAHPGGAQGIYDVFVTASENVIVSTPAPYTDTTDYGFGLAIVASGGTPTLVPDEVDLVRLVGHLIWDGSKITSVMQIVPALPLHAVEHRPTGSDPLAPGDIGAALASDLILETTARQNADTALSNALTSETSSRATADNALAPRDSPTLTGTPRASAAIPPDENSTRLATTAWAKGLPGLGARQWDYGHEWAVAGTLSVAPLLPLLISQRQSSGVTKRLLGFYAVLGAGTATIKIRRATGFDLSSYADLAAFSGSSALGLTTTPQAFIADASVTLADRDILLPVITAASGASDLALLAIVQVSA